MQLAKQGIRNADHLPMEIRAYIAKWEQLSKLSAIECRLVHVSECSSSTFKELDGFVSADVDCIACVTAMMGKARLIDNIRLDLAWETWNN